MFRNQWLAVILAGGLLATATTATGTAAMARTSGIYLTAADYEKAQFTSKGDCKSEAHKTELHDDLNKSYVDVTHDGNRYRYRKSEVFGFRSCEGADYRFVGNREYQILEAKALYIYRTVRSETRGKSVTNVATYYFSVGGAGDVLALTALDLKQVLPDNHSFHDSLDTPAGIGRLEQHDDFHKMFRVNHLLEASGRAVMRRDDVAQPSIAPPDAAHHVKVFKLATCGCCKQWIAHMTRAGFVVDAEDVPDLAPVKVAHKVPPALRTCHTAVIDGYIVEGHVPADVIETLIRDRPAVSGIGVAGMPKGSPGMESPTPQPYQVLAFRDGQIAGVFATR